MTEQADGVLRGSQLHVGQWVGRAVQVEGRGGQARAKRMLALFLLNIEAPGLEARGNLVPEGSSLNFIKDAVQLELMMPRPRKE